MPTYDAKGNLTSAGGPTYGYTTKNELATSTAGGSPQFYRDTLGRLDLITTSSTTTKFQYDGTNITNELNASNVITKRYVYGPGDDEALVQYDGADFATRRYLVADERGSIIATTDASGNALSLNSYDEYGIPASTNQGRFGYTGQAWIPELGMNSYKARIYSPTLGRFLQTDPAGYPDGPNWYGYTMNDPINRTDPTGLYDAEIVVTNKYTGSDYLSGGNISIGSDYGADLAMQQVMMAIMNAQYYDKNLKKKQEEGKRQDKKDDPCNSIFSKIGNAFEAAGKGTSYSGLTIAGIGAFAGPEGAAPGLFITEVGGIISTLGQVSQDIAFHRPFGEIAGRAFVNTIGVRAVGNVVPRSQRTAIGDAISGQAFGDTASSAIDWLDPNRCPK